MPAPYKGYEPITIDGCECFIGWTDDEENWEGYFSVIRHGCQIGKGDTKERAISEAAHDLAGCAWLRGPKP